MLFWNKIRFYLLAATYDFAGESVHGLSVCLKQGRGNVFDIMEYTAFKLNIEVGRISPVFFSEIKKDQFDALNESFNLITKRNAELASKIKAACPMGKQPSDVM